MPKEKVEFEDVECIADSGLAILVTGLKDWPTWVPQSVVDEDSEVWELDQKGTLILHEWWAHKEGLV